MKIKKQELYKQYKEIQKICIEKGELIPILIECIHIPNEYKLSLEEESEITVNEKVRKERYLKHSEIEYEIINKKNEKYNSLMEYWTDQLKQFIEKYSQFENIIEEE